MHDVLYSEQFVQGLSDYKDGKPRKPDQSKAYNKGYTVAFQNDHFKGVAK